MQHVARERRRRHGDVHPVTAKGDDLAAVGDAVGEAGRVVLDDVERAEPQDQA
jgi:hypothetical protein